MNHKLQKIFNEDQKDRSNQIVLNNHKLLTRRDRVRKNIVRDLLRQRRMLSPKDYYMAAMVFHHGPTIKDSKKAVYLAKICIESGYKRGLSLYATCIDRLLIRQKKRQKFGTQYQKKDIKSDWKLLPYNTKTTDEERLKYNLMTIIKMKKHIAKLNKNKAILTLSIPT